MNKKNYLLELYKGKRLYDLPYEERSMDVCLLAIVRNPEDITYVPLEVKQTAGFYTKVQKANVNSVKLMDPWYIAVKKGLALSRVPYDRRTVEVCKTALHKDLTNISYVPENIKSMSSFDSIYKEILKQQNRDEKTERSRILAFFRVYKAR